MKQSIKKPQQFWTFCIAPWVFHGVKELTGGSTVNRAVWVGTGLGGGQRSSCILGSKLTGIFCCLVVY